MLTGLGLGRVTCHPLLSGRRASRAHDWWPQPQSPSWPSPSQAMLRHPRGSAHNRSPWSPSQGGHPVHSLPAPRQPRADHHTNTPRCGLGSIHVIKATEHDLLTLWPTGKRLVRTASAQAHEVLLLDPTGRHGRGSLTRPSRGTPLSHAEGRRRWCQLPELWAVRGVDAPPLRSRSAG